MTLGLIAMRENYRVLREGIYLIHRGVSRKTLQTERGWLGVRSVYLEVAERNREGVQH